MAVPGIGKALCDECFAKRRTTARDDAQLAPIDIGVSSIAAGLERERAIVQECNQLLGRARAQGILARAPRRMCFRRVDVGDANLFTVQIEGLRRSRS